MKRGLFYRALVAICAAAILSSAAPAQQQPPVPWKCPGNIVTNGGFDSNTVISGPGSMPTSHTDAWTLAYGTPQLQGGAGCHDPDYISFWGNQVVGEAIQESATLLAGHTYHLSACVQFHLDQGKLPKSVRFVFRGSTAPLSSPACSGTCETFVTTSDVTSQSWITINACFTPLRNESILTVSPSNASSQADGAQTSFGRIDDICITEVKAPVIEGPPTACTTPATYCVKPPATGPFTWAVNNGTFVNANADGSCVLVTWNQANNGGAIHVTSTVAGCPITSNLNVPECNHPICCRDVKASLGTSAMVSGGMALTFNLSGPSTPATSVMANILGASHVSLTPGCGTNGPITATASSTQPPSPPGWGAANVPFLNGNQVVWNSTPSNGSPIGAGPFVINVQLPPTGGSSKCNDDVTICIEFVVTFAGTPTTPCRTCTFVQCFKFRRCPLCQ